MCKKFLAVMAIVGLFTTGTASALTVGGGPGGNPVQSYIDNFAVAPDPFIPGDSESATVRFNLSRGADIYAYAIDEQFEVYEIEGSGLAPVSTQPGNITYTWYGTEGNVEGAEALDEGVYEVKVFASVNGSIVDFDLESGVTIGPEVVVVDEDAPRISNLSADPLIFSAEGNEDTEISFDVDKDAYLTVEVKAGNEVVAEFPDYDGETWYRAIETHSINWNGTYNNDSDDDGELVSDGVYVVKVTANNNDGTTTATIDIRVETAGVTSDGVIRDLKLDPSGIWDPADEELEIGFELTGEVKSLTIDAKNGNKVIEILDDEYVDDDDYTELWNGTDDDGDYVKEGTWEIIVRADGDKVSTTIRVEYEKPTISTALVTKSSFDPAEDEFTNLVFKVDSAAVVTVDAYKGSKKEFTLLDEANVIKNKWYAVKWNGMDEDGEEVDFGKDWKFKITAENPTDDDVFYTEIIEVNVEEDDASDKKSNVTNDSVSPVVFDDQSASEITMSYYIDEQADVYIAVYEGNSTSGKAEIELLDYVSQSAGMHTVSWNGKDDRNKDLKDGVYSYKIITKANGNYKETEVGKFVVGNAGTYTDTPEDKDPVPSDCAQYSDTRYLNDDEVCKAINWVTEEEIFHGYGDGTFKPYQDINRVEVLKVVLRAIDDVAILSADGSNQGFSDVDANAWYMPYVRTAKFYGMLHGDAGKDTVRPGDTVNRAELLKLVLEASESFTEYVIPYYTETGYADVDNMSPAPWYKDYAGVANALMLVDEHYDMYSGQFNLDPARLVQRGEMALLLYRMHINGLLN